MGLKVLLSLNALYSDKQHFEGLYQFKGYRHWKYTCLKLLQVFIHMY